MNNSLRNEFKEFLIKQGYKLRTPSGKNSTVYSYQKGIDYVCEIENCNWEELATNITTAIHDYGPNGEKSKYGAKSHYTVFNALKQYQEFINKEKNFDIDKIINNIKKNINQKIIKEIEHPQNLETEKQALIKVRIGHSKLKENVLKIKQACDICGLKHPKLLIASHIKPWAKSNDYEKLDCENILLLCPMHDALFDKGLISFDRHGHILISKELNQQNLALMNIDKKNNINITSQRQQDYLDWHRKNIFIN